MAPPSRPQVNAAARPNAAELLLDPLLQAHSLTFEESVDRCAESTRVLKQARGAGLRTDGQSATAGHTFHQQVVDYQQPSVVEGTSDRAGLDGGEGLDGIVSSSGAPCENPTGFLSRWEAKLSMLLVEHEIGSLGHLLAESLEVRVASSVPACALSSVPLPPLRNHLSCPHFAQESRLHLDEERVQQGIRGDVEKWLLRQELFAMERQVERQADEVHYERQPEPSLRHDASHAHHLQPPELPAQSERVLHVPMANRPSHPTAAPFGHGVTAAYHALVAQAKAAGRPSPANIEAEPLATPPTRLTPSPSESSNSKDGSISVAATVAALAAPRTRDRWGTDDAECSADPCDGAHRGASRATSLSPPALPEEAELLLNPGGGGGGPGAVPAGVATAGLGELQPLELLRELREAEELLHARELQVAALKQMKKREEQVKLLARTTRQIATRAFDGWRRALIDARSARAIAHKDSQIQLLTARLRQMAEAITDHNDKAAAVKAVAEVLHFLPNPMDLPATDKTKAAGPATSAGVGGGGGSGTTGGGGGGGGGAGGASGCGGGAQASRSSTVSNKSPLRQRSHAHGVNSLGDGLILFERGGHVRESVLRDGDRSGGAWLTGPMTGAGGSGGGGGGASGSSVTDSGCRERDVARADAGRGEAARSEVGRSEASREERAKRFNEAVRSPGGLYERGVKQRQKREAAVSRRRREREAAELASCTFTPAIKTVVDKEGREVIKYLEPQGVPSKNARSKGGNGSTADARQALSPDRPAAEAAELNGRGVGGSNGSSSGNANGASSADGRHSPDRHRRSTDARTDARTDPSVSAEAAESGGGVAGDGSGAAAGSTNAEAVGNVVGGGGGIDGEASTNRSGSASDSGRGHQTSVVIMSAISSAVMSALPKALDSYRERRHSRQHSERSSQGTPHAVPLPPPVHMQSLQRLDEDQQENGSLEAAPPPSPDSIAKYAAGGFPTSLPVPATAEATTAVQEGDDDGSGTELEGVLDGVDA